MNSLNFRKLLVKYVVIFLLFFVYNHGQGLAAQSKEQGSIQEQETEYAKKYNFTTDWVTHNIPTWEKVLHQFKGKSNINYLEIGVWEGRSLIWMLENILTHPTSKATCIDIFYHDKVKQRFRANLKASGFLEKVTVITGRSQFELKYLPLESFDIIYIDGSHSADNVLADAVLSWQLLKNNGLLILDDYLFNLELPIELRPQFAIDAFMTAYKDSVGEVVYKGYQVILRKKDPHFLYFSAPFGQYIYVFGRRELYRSGVKNPESIQLSDIEKSLIERLIMSKDNDNTKFSLNNEILKDKDFINLRDRLKLNFQFSEDNKITE